MLMSMPPQAPSQPRAIAVPATDNYTKIQNYASNEHVTKEKTAASHHDLLLLTYSI